MLERRKRLSIEEIEKHSEKYEKMREEKEKERERKSFSRIDNSSIKFPKTIWDQRI